MKRVLILGPGAAGKSTLAKRLAEVTGLPVIELDKLFWGPGLVATPREQWVSVQREIIGRSDWILDGDLGPYDDLPVRLSAADTVIFLDFSLARCAWRAFRRSRERWDFWAWLFAYRWRSRPRVLATIRAHAAAAQLHILRNPHEVRRFLATLGMG